MYDYSMQLKSAIVFWFRTKHANENQYVKLIMSHDIHE